MAAMGMDIEQLSVRIVSDSSAAVAGVDKLIDALERLNNTSVENVSKAFDAFRGVSAKVAVAV